MALEPANAYPADYSATADIAKEERDANARPEIANLPESIEEYDTIFAGYPIWWHTAPMIIGTFLESFDFSGKDIYPFSQSASMDTEHFANSMAFVRENAVGANVHEGLFVNASDTEGIQEYLTANGFAKYAVNSLRAGDDIKTVQENLGHATASFTLSTYAGYEEGKCQTHDRIYPLCAGRIAV